MKKSLALILTIFLFQFVNAQEWTQTAIGAKGGLNFANIGGTDTDNATKLAGHLGAYADAYFQESLRFQIELMLSGQGHAPKTDLAARLKLLYLNIPLIVRFYPVNNFSLHAGPQLGFLLNAKAEYQDITYDIKDSFKGIDLGAALGAGYDFNLAGRDINVTLRYIHGLINIADDPTNKRFNRVFQLALGIMIVELLQGS
ncbi:MAG TPA: porin family protein [Cyclobacteriaceae bacterium]|nr:porin family protein [Cyclobacteriaceae bacterium]